MTTQIEAMKMMVEALEISRPPYLGSKQEAHHKAIAAGRAAIEAAEKVEPVLYMRKKELPWCGIANGKTECGFSKYLDFSEPLYTHPPSAEIEELRRDAARYQWLKKHKFRWNGHCWHSQFGDVLRHTDIDAAIDSAMQEKLP